MTYGQGLPHSRTLSQRLAAHLNGALLGQFVEGISLGLCGACLFHAIERVEDLALPLDPDVLIVAACCNDAYMLRGQPPTNEEIGQTWVSFRPHLEEALERLAARMRDRRTRVALLYFDRSPTYGSVSPAQVLREICEAVDLPFIDGSEMLRSYPVDAITVSEADGHLNALANDVVARHVARFLTERSWLPEAAPFSQPAWLESIREWPRALADSGVPPLLASARTLSVLEGKWLDRRNRQRHALETMYASARADIIEDQRDPLARLSWNAMGRWVHDHHHPEGSLAFAEARLHELSTIVSALEYTATAGDLHQNVDELRHILGADEEGDAAALADTARGVLARSAAALNTLNAARHALPAADGLSMELGSLHAVINRASGLLSTLDRSAERLETVAGRSQRLNSAGAQRLLRYAERSLGLGIDRLAQWAENLPWEGIRNTLESWALSSPTMMLELVIAANPGPETWPLGIGVESLYPFYQATSVHTANVIRDGHPHVYAVELPLMLLGDVYLTFSGPSMLADGSQDAVRVFPATLTVPGLAPKRLANNLTFSSRSDSSVTFAYRSVFLFEE